MIRGVVYIDGTVESVDHWQSDRLVMQAIDETNRNAARGTPVRLFVGSKHAPWPASAYGAGYRIDPIWATFVEKFNIQLEGTVWAVKEWTESLNQCVASPPVGMNAAS